MQNKTTFSGLDPKTIRMTGSGEYVKEQTSHLQDLFDQAEHDFKEELRQEHE